MKQLISIALCLSLTASVSAVQSAGAYKGKYCDGAGDVEYLRMIDRSFACFHAGTDGPNISMVYTPAWDMFLLGPMWPLWWVQNSYGPSFCSMPFLQEPWRTTLQHSQDTWFDHIGDGKTKDSFDPLRPPGVDEIIPPDGCLVDAASPVASYHRQGDDRWWIHDWFYEATAAGVLMQGELLLTNRDMDAIHKYLPRLHRACDFVERARDPKNGLFLVGPACNLLAPSYGGVRQPDGTFGKGYLTGVSITYLAALDRMVELCKLTADNERLERYENRRKITRDSLPLLMTPEGYFVKSMEPDGTKHGVYGQTRYGYFETSPNVDAICHRVVDSKQSETIYAKIASIPEMRPNSFLIANYPGLDDMYAGWGTTELPGTYGFGQWVNGGAWLTEEARAIMAYYRLGKYDDVRNSARAFRKFADEYQLDAPFTDCGRGLWFKDNLTNICHDDFGVPAAVVRGLFEYVYKADSLTLIPHIPSSIREYSQKEPIIFGEKRMLIHVRNGGPTVKSLKVNGRKWDVTARDSVALPYESLPKEARIELVMTGGWAEASSGSESGGSAPTAKALVSRPAVRLPADMRKPFARLDAMRKQLGGISCGEYVRSLVGEAAESFEAYRDRAQGYYDGAYPGMTRRKHGAILSLHKGTAMNLYTAVENLMNRYASDGDPSHAAVASVWKACAE